MVRAVNAIHTCAKISDTEYNIKYGKKYQLDNEYDY